MSAAKHEIKAGDVCRCSAGKLGMVTAEGRQHVVYPDGNEGEAYVGICITDGREWSSRNPEFICTVVQLLVYLSEARADQYVREMQFDQESDPEDAARYAFQYASRA